ncbi:condensation domain-containing protein, partial [Roseateles flavus]
AANVQDIYPLAPLQEGILFHHLMEKEGDPYLLPSLLGFASRERLERFMGALQQVMDRHDILRTGIAWEGLEQPVQVVRRRVRFPLEILTLDPAQGDIAEQLEARYDPRHYRLDVSQAPLMQGYAAEDAAQGRWLLRLLSHHLISDHTTVELLVEEALAIEAGQLETLAAPAPFRNFVAQACLGVSQAEHETFFRQMLGDIEEPTAPFGLLDVQGDGSQVKEAGEKLPAALSAQLRQQARRLGVSTASLMHLAWALVLARTTGRQDVVFGTVLFGRMQGGEQSDRVLGMFINTLPLRLSVGSQGLGAGLRQVHQLLAQLLRHEHAPLALAQRCSAVPAQTPLFSSLLNYRYSVQGSAAAQAAQEVEGIEELGGHERTNYPLTLSVDDLGEDFLITALVSEPVDPQRVCAFMHEALQAVATALGARPETPLASLDVLPSQERAQLLGWGVSQREYPREEGLAALF